MTNIENQPSNLNPTPEAVVATWLWKDLYEKQSGGPMDFHYSLKGSEQLLCRDCVAEISEALNRQPEVRTQPLAEGREGSITAETSWEWHGQDGIYGFVTVTLGDSELGHISFDQYLGNKPSVRNQIEEIVQQAYDTGLAHGDEKARAEFRSAVRTIMELAE